MSAELHSVSIGPVQLLWERAPDRWRHRLLADERVLLTSEEGDGTDLFPPSPAYQEMLIESPEPGISEFQLMGLSGRTVYSASVRVNERERIIDFDCCARIKQEETTTRSIATYRLPTGATRSAGADGLTLEWNAGPEKPVALKLMPLSMDGAVTSVHQEGALWSVGWFRPTSIDPVRGSSFRWGYRIAIKAAASD